jgi:hypothetical protein
MLQARIANLEVPNKEALHVPIAGIRQRLPHFAAGSDDRPRTTQWERQPATIVSNLGRPPITLAKVDPQGNVKVLLAGIFRNVTSTAERYARPKKEVACFRDREADALSRATEASD